MKTRLKKFSSLLLSLCIILNMVPTAVFAQKITNMSRSNTEITIEENENNAEDGDVENVEETEGTEVQEPQEGTEEDTPVKYNIVVHDGTAEPSSAAAGERVTIQANSAKYYFSKWIAKSNNVEFEYPRVRKTHFTMPAEDVEILALFYLNEPENPRWDKERPGVAKWDPVENASGYRLILDKERIYQKVFEVDVGADITEYNFIPKMEELGIGPYYFRLLALGDGEEYDNSQYEVQVDKSYVYDPNNQLIYRIQVTNGIADPTEAKVGDIVTITANEAPEDYHFEKWHIWQGEVELADEYAETTTFVMPAENVELDARYRYAGMIVPSAPWILDWSDISPGCAWWVDEEGWGELYGVQLFLNGEFIKEVSTHRDTCYDFNEDMEAFGEGEYQFRVKIFGNGENMEDSDWSKMSSVYSYPPPHFIFVNSGSAEPFKAKAGETVTITAEEAAVHKHFKEWKIEKGAVALADANAATTTFEMPAEEVELTAIYEEDPKYEITVNNGSAAPTEAYAGETVTITAEEAAVHKHFKEWKIVKGAVVLANANAATTTFEMPAEEVELTAIYEEDDPIVLAVPTALAWDTEIPGKGTWNFVENAIGYNIKLFKNGGVILSETGYPSVEFDFTEKIRELGAGEYSFKVQAVGDEVIYAESAWSEMSPIYNYTPEMPTYVIFVNSGTADPSRTMAGETVTITADPAKRGYKFKAWVVDKGNVALTNATEESTSFIMPAEDVELTATYEKKPPRVIKVTVYFKPFGSITFTITIDAQTAEEIEAMINEVKAKIEWLKKFFKIRRIRWQW